MKEKAGHKNVEQGIDGNDDDEESKDYSVNSGKVLGVFLGVVIVIFVGLFAYSHYFKAQPAMTIDEMHEYNLHHEPTKDMFVYNGYSFVRTVVFSDTEK